MIYFLYIILLFITEIIYFKVAAHFNIIDHPNERSSHTDVTIRGGGIIIVFAAIIALIWHSEFYLPLFGIIVIGIISFLDDIYTLSNRVRIIFHIGAVSLTFIFLKVFSAFTLLEIVSLYILIIGIINAYNFMDGINGMTGCYSLVILGALQYVNVYQSHFIRNDLIWLPILGCLVFLFFNFRKNAKCFAGDVGSITIALWIVMLIFDLIFQTKNLCYILFLAVYGVESILTICHRLLLKQNIFKAHRLHVYQLLVNEQRLPHLFVSLCYAILQAMIIWFVIMNKTLAFATLMCVILLPLILCYVVIKRRSMRQF